jgi:hypothetical protein
MVLGRQGSSGRQQVRYLFDGNLPRRNRDLNSGYERKFEKLKA